MKSKGAYLPEIPAWLNEVLEGEKLLSRSEQMRFFDDLHHLYINRRIDPVANVLFHLTVAAIKHNRQILFLEEAVQHQTMEIITLKTKLRNLTKKQGGTP